MRVITDYCKVCPNLKKDGSCDYDACMCYDGLPVKDVLIFPHTIGQITFYKKSELIDWALEQSRINND